MVAALGEFIEADASSSSPSARTATSFYNKGAHPYHRSWMQRQCDEYIRREVIPFIHTTARARADRDDGRLARRLSRREQR